MYKMKLLMNVKNFKNSMKKLGLVRDIGIVECNEEGKLITL